MFTDVDFTLNLDSRKYCVPKCWFSPKFIIHKNIMYTNFSSTACYAGLLLAPAEVFGLQPRLFCPMGKKELFTLFVLISGHFWYSVITSVMVNSNLSYFESYPKISKTQKKNQKLQKSQKIRNFKKKSQKIQKIQKNIAKKSNNITINKKIQKNVQIIKNLKKNYFFFYLKLGEKKISSVFFSFFFLPKKCS